MSQSAPVSPTYDPCSSMALGLGRTDPTGIREMPWGPPPKGAQQNSKTNANQQKFVMRNAQLAFDNSAIVRKKTVGI